MQPLKYRDLSIIPIPFGNIIVASDSCGGIGEKPGDTMHCDSVLSGHAVARVVLFEMMSIGAKILCLSDNLCCEMEPTGRKIIKGFIEELHLAGLCEDILTGSTEENFTTSMTALGCTCVGYIEGEFQFPKCFKGDLLFSIGYPLVGEAFITSDKPKATYTHLKTLRENPHVHEIVPVGSHGIMYEAQLLCSIHGFCFLPLPNPGVDMNVSGGPSSCVIIAADRKIEKEILHSYPATLIGTMN